MTPVNRVREKYIASAILQAMILHKPFVNPYQFTIRTESTLSASAAAHMTMINSNEEFFSDDSFPNIIPVSVPVAEYFESSTIQSRTDMLLTTTNEHIRKSRITPGYDKLDTLDKQQIDLLQHDFIKMLKMDEMELETLSNQLSQLISITSVHWLEGYLLSLVDSLKDCEKSNLLDTIVYSNLNIRAEKISKLIYSLSKSDSMSLSLRAKELIQQYSLVETEI